MAYRFLEGFIMCLCKVITIFSESSSGCSQQCSNGVFWDPSSFFDPEHLHKLATLYISLTANSSPTSFSCLTSHSPLFLLTASVALRALVPLSRSGALIRVRLLQSPRLRLRTTVVLPSRPHSEHYPHGKRPQSTHVGIFCSVPR